MSKIEKLREARDQLVALRGKQDQTIRCGVIAILHRIDGKKDGKETTRFLEGEIERINDALHAAKVEAFDRDND